MTDIRGRQMIENSDRGITLNKSLAWTVAVALVMGGLWVGTTVTRLGSATDQLIRELARTDAELRTDRTAATAIEGRVRALETLTTRQDARFDALSKSLDEVKAAQRETNALLRQLTGVRP